MTYLPGGYTNPWSNTIPSGNTPANQIDDHIRQVRFDVAQRLGEIFVDFAASPLVFRDFILGKATGKKMLIPPHAFIGADLDPVAFGDDSVATTEVTTLYAPVILPPGAVITQIRAAVKRGATGVLNFALLSHTFNTAVTLAVESIISQGITANTTTIIDTGVIAVGSRPVIDAAKTYKLKQYVASPNSLLFHWNYGVEITYDVDSSLVTL
jgi:hypothetical protein